MKKNVTQCNSWISDCGYADKHCMSCCFSVLPMRYVDCKRSISFYWLFLLSLPHLQCRKPRYSHFLFPRGLIPWLQRLCVHHVLLTTVLGNCRGGGGGLCQAKVSRQQGLISKFLPRGLPHRLILPASEWVRAIATQIRQRGTALNDKSCFDPPFTAHGQAQKLSSWTKKYKNT